MSDPFEALRLRFVARCRAQLAVLGAAMEDPTPSEESVQRIAHSMAGTGGTLGFPAISDRASQLDDLLSTPDADPAQIRAALHGLIVEIWRLPE